MASTSPPWMTLCKMLFFAVLNLADFVTDVLVLLRLSCAIDAPDVRRSCGDSMGIVGTNITNSRDAESSLDGVCQAHPWWFAIGATLLGASMFISGYFYALGKKDALWRFVITIFQLAPFIEVAQVLRKGEDYLDDLTRLRIMTRELKVKQFESAPQAVMQTYILWSLGTHTQPLNVFSVVISVSSLALSLGVVLPEKDKLEQKLAQKLRDLGEIGDLGSVNVESNLQVVIGLANPTHSHETSDCPGPATCIPPMEELFIGKAVLAAYLASDLGLRCVGYALLFSPSVRHAGIPTAIASILGYSCIISISRERQSGRLRSIGANDKPNTVLLVLTCPCQCIALPSLFTYFALMPTPLLASVYPWPFGWFEALGLCFRFLEYGIFAGLIMGLGQTACGERLTWEPQAFLCLLGFNILVCVLYYGILRPCCRPALAHFEGRCENWAMALLGQLSSCRKSLASSAWSCGIALLELLSSCREALTSCRCCRKQVDTE